MKSASTHTNEVLRNRRRLPTNGCGVGILHIDTNFPLVPGNPQNATTFDFPVRYELIDGLSVADLLCGGGAAKVILAAQAMRDAGVAAIVGACGSLVNYQSALLRALDVPVFASVMVAVPLLLSSIGPTQKLGVIFASSDSYTGRVRRESGITEPGRIVVADCRELEAFRPILANQDYLDTRSLQKQLVDQALAMTERHPDIGMLLLQCSDLAPYAQEVARATSLPVFDVTQLIRWVHSGVAHSLGHNAI